jgi:hypothetical protein
MQPSSHWATPGKTLDLVLGSDDGDARRRSLVEDIIFGVDAARRWF